jgi:hypothetical protein
MLIDQPKTFPLTWREQLDRIYGNDRTRGHAALVKPWRMISSTWRSAAAVFRL